MKVYQHIVFMQGHEADEPLTILSEQGLDALAAFLCQGDYGEGETSKESGFGSSDTVYKLDDGLRISVNYSIGYVGACRLIDEDE